MEPTRSACSSRESRHRLHISPMPVRSGSSRQRQRCSRLRRPASRQRAPVRSVTSSASTVSASAGARDQRAPCRRLRPRRASRAPTGHRRQLRPSLVRTVIVGRSPRQTLHRQGHRHGRASIHSPRTRVVVICWPRPNVRGSWAGFDAGVARRAGIAARTEPRHPRSTPDCPRRMSKSVRCEQMSTADSHFAHREAVNRCRSVGTTEASVFRSGRTGESSCSTDDGQRRRSGVLSPFSAASPSAARRS